MTDTNEAGDVETPPPAPPLEGIAICGSHPVTVEMAPFQDPSWRIYACSPHNVEMRTLPRVDEWFEVHRPYAHETRGMMYWEALKAMECPVWVRDEEAARFIKRALPYPEEEMKRLFGPFTFTSSIAYMLAKAICDCRLMKIPAIGIFGVMQASPNEYSYQRPGIQNLIWEAVRNGLKVYAPDISRLFEPQPDIW